MRRDFQRLAWGVLLTSFFTCIALAVMAPLGARWFILNARVGQQVTLEVHRAPLSVTLAGHGQPVSVAEDSDDIVMGTIVATNSTSGRLVICPPQVDEPLATVQIYEHTEVVLASARSPRFSASRLPHRTVLEVATGRVRIRVPGDDRRATVVEVRTPHGAATLTEGNYEIKASETRMETTVRDGQAKVTSNSEHVARIGPDERATADGEHVVGPLPAARNLITNSDFHAPLSAAWTSYSDQEEEPPGTVAIVKEEGRQVASFYRRGSNHAEVGIGQEINHDVRALASLQLHLAVQIRGHDVPVCGTYGSECPVMVRIQYRDAQGARQEWLQGFYSRVGTSTPENPSVCVTCSTRNEHIRIPTDTWYPYLSPNLIPLLSRDGKPPTTIESITIYASGHTFQSTVTEVELIGRE